MFAISFSGCNVVSLGRFEFIIEFPEMSAPGLTEYFDSCPPSLSPLAEVNAVEATGFAIGVILFLVAQNGEM